MKLQSIHQYPIKSLQGVSLPQVTLQPRGVPHDRALALYDVATHSITSRKHPTRYPQIERLKALVEGEQILLQKPDGATLPAESEEANQWLSAYFHRELRVVREAPAGAKLHQLWSDVEGLAPESARSLATKTDEEGVTADDFAQLAPGTLFDAAPLHLAFTSSAARLARLSGREVQLARFRANLIFETDNTDAPIEDLLIGKTLRLGEATLKVIVHSPRCIVPSLPTSTLPPDKELLRALVAHQRREVATYGSFACFGVYAKVVTPGAIKLGDTLLSS